MLDRVIYFDRAKLDRFRNLTVQAKRSKKESFQFEGLEVSTAAAAFDVEYLRHRFTQPVPLRMTSFQPAKSMKAASGQ